MGFTSLGEVVAALGEEPALRAWEVVRRGESALELSDGEARAVLLWPGAWSSPEKLTPHLARARANRQALVLVGTDHEFAGAKLSELETLAEVHLAPAPIPEVRLASLLRSCTHQARQRHERDELEVDLGRARHENELLASIGRALSQQRDIDSLLGIILDRAREVTGADAASVYVVEGDASDPTERSIRFKIAQNDSMPTTVKGDSLPVSSESIVGACVLSGEVVQIPDLYALDAPGQGNNPWGFVHDRSFDDASGYQSRSVVALPMIDARGQCIGVIQLLNKRGPGIERIEPEMFDSQVVPFDPISVNFATALASQAGVALENALLYDEVKTLFEGFVRASVTAIESRDPTTSGHSQRVADLTLSLARAADRIDDRPFSELSFSYDDLKQIEYAALLHDFGKVGVRENVLVKAKKLYHHERARIEERFKFIRRSIEADGLRSKLEYALAENRAALEQRLAAVDSDVADRLRELDDQLGFILRANEPSVLERSGFERVEELSQRLYVDYDGAQRPLITPVEAGALQILRGSLTGEERHEIESHVVHTFNFLRQIPWGQSFRMIPEIAGAHHEKLDGSGYPHGLAAAEIPVPAKMMTISDIFDALTASDRPYKRAVPTEKALDILASDVKAGKLDADLFALFVDAKCFHAVGKDTPEGAA